MVMEKISLSTKTEWRSCHVGPICGIPSIFHLLFSPHFSTLNIHYYNLRPKKHSYQNQKHSTPEGETCLSKKNGLHFCCVDGDAAHSCQPEEAAECRCLPQAIAGLTAAALTYSMIVPAVAEAAVSPSLKNFLLSIVAGGVVLSAIVGAVVGVSNFDPVKRT